MMWGEVRLTGLEIPLCGDVIAAAGIRRSVHDIEIVRGVPA
jgi:hypothetical protein